MSDEEQVAEAEQEGQEEVPASRIVIEFAGPGMADIKQARLENVSLGQVLALARWAEWQAQQQIERYEKAKRNQAKRMKLAVPRGVVA